jgi:hypothetical protein
VLRGIYSSSTTEGDAVASETKRSDTSQDQLKDSIREGFDEARGVLANDCRLFRLLEFRRTRESYDERQGDPAFLGRDALAKHLKAARRKR